MESLVQAPGTRLMISELSLIEIQSVFSTKVRTGGIDRATLDQLRGFSIPILPTGVSKSFCGSAVIFRAPRRSFEPTRWTTRSERRCRAVVGGA